MANMGCIMLCANAFEGDHLAHYGVMGMKWGVRRYQPYPSDYVGNGRYIGKPSTTPEGLKPTLREKIREYAKSGHALTRAKEYSLDRRIANRAERMQKRFVKKQTNRYAKALGSGNEAKIARTKLKLDQEKKTQEALQKLQQDLTDQRNASFVTARNRRPISQPLGKFGEAIKDFFSDLPLLSTMSLDNLSNTYAMRRVVQNSLEEANVLNKPVDEVINANLREEISAIKRLGASSDVSPAATLKRAKRIVEAVADL